MTVQADFGDNSSGGGFPDSFAGNQGTMLTETLQSSPFVPGSVGWQIKRNGDAQFNNGTFTGVVTGSTFEGTDFIINPNGIFFYSGAI